ncbi:PAS domain S-box protein [Bordetella sp. 2513F-2]
MTASRQRAERAHSLLADYRYQLLVEAVMDYAIYLLDADGYVSSWNAGAQRFKGYTADEIIGRHFSLFYTPEDRDAGMPRRALETARREGRFEAEGWRVRKDGSRFWSSVVIDPVRDDTGEIIGYAKITRDITDKKQAQEDVQRARDALNHAQKMEAIGHLTGGVAHDFNNLLTVIQGSVELLRRPGLPEERRRRYIDAIAETTERAAHLTRQLLAYARRQPLQPRNFDARACVESMRTLMDTTVGSAADVRYHYHPGPCAVYADPQQFETALLNIVINARDAMSREGNITISVARVPRRPAIRQRPAVEEPHVAVSVRDEGSGIPPELMERIFEPFFSTKAVNQGTGLGLSQVIGFTGQSGGDVEVRSEVGIGSTFTIYLPEVPLPAQLEVVEPGLSRPGAESPARRTVLLVEDNTAVGEVVRNLLQDLGQEAIWVTDGVSALQVLEEDQHGIDLVISDVVMAGMSGMELAQQIRARWPSLRVVIASGYSHVLAQHGSHGFELLQKPYSVDLLKQVLAGGQHPHGT